MDLPTRTPQARRRGALAAGLAVFLAVAPGLRAAQDPAPRPRAREAGVVVGILDPGRWNAITDVEGVAVGHATVVAGDSIRTGVTAVVPAPGDLYANPVPGWVHVGNGYGKLIGETQVREFGEIETPILLTCTLCVWAAAEGLADALLHRPGENRHTINPLVGETNDSRVNDMWADPVRTEHVREALDNAGSGPVEEGSVGAGTGTQAFGWKGGIGTASRVLPDALGGWTVGALVQTNFGGVLTINGAPVGQELDRYPYADVLEGLSPDTDEPQDGGSIMMVVATDAPLAPLELDRLARRAMMGLARTGSYASDSSGDYVIAFSTAGSVRRPRGSTAPLETEHVLHASMSPLFLATVEATEEAIYNALFRATTVTSGRGTLEAIPLERTLEILERYGALGRERLRPHGPR